MYLKDQFFLTKFEFRMIVKSSFRKNYFLFFFWVVVVFFWHEINFFEKRGGAGVMILKFCCKICKPPSFFNFFNCFSWFKYSNSSVPDTLNGTDPVLDRYRSGAWPGHFRSFKIAGTANFDISSIKLTGTVTGTLTGTGNFSVFFLNQ